VRYHPLFESIWNEAKLDGCSLEERGFAIYLFSNPRVRPSGIYRVTDAQAATDTGIPEKRAALYLADLAVRRFIVRDGSWMFIAGYLARQPKQPFLLKGVEHDVMDCSSVFILEAFHKKYPLLDRWSANRRATIGQWLGNGPTRAYAEQMQSRCRADAEQMQSSTTVGQRSPTPPAPKGLARSARVSLPLPPGFERFWKAYPNKVGKDRAVKRWGEKACEAIADEVIAGLHRTWKHVTRDSGKWVPLPDTWLNQGRWKDEPPDNGHQAGFGTLDMSGLEDFARRHKHDQ
jgi:hypothetical protein